jgi:hypothetical protein
MTLNRFRNLALLALTVIGTSAWARGPGAAPLDSRSPADSGAPALKTRAVEAKLRHLEQMVGFLMKTTQAYECTLKLSADANRIPAAAPTSAFGKNEKEARAAAGKICESEKASATGCVVDSCHSFNSAF